MRVSYLGSICWLWILISDWISLLTFRQRFFIFKYAVEIVMESIRKPSELLDTNSSVSTMCFRHLFAPAVCRCFKNKTLKIYMVQNKKNDSSVPSQVSRNICCCMQSKELTPPPSVSGSFNFELSQKSFYTLKSQSIKL